MTHEQASNPSDATELLQAARKGDEVAFVRLVMPLRPGLYAHCYRLLGSLQDAEDALQEALLSAWRGLAGFEGKSSLCTWLFTIATHASLRLASRRPRRVVSSEVSPAADPTVVAYLWNDSAGAFKLAVLNLLTFRGDKVAAVSAFLDDALLARCGLSATWPGDP